MGLLDKFLKKSISHEDAGEVLVRVAMSGVQTFFEKYLPAIAEDIGVNYKDYDKDALRAEIMIICLWAALKALQGQDQKLLSSIQNACFNCVHEERREAFEIGFTQRHNIYSEAWDDNSGSNQSIFIGKILAVIFYAGKHNESLLNYFAMARMQTFVFDTMLDVLTCRKEMKLKG